MDAVRIFFFALWLYAFPIGLLAQNGPSEAYRQFSKALNSEATDLNTLPGLLNAMQSAEEKNLARVDWANLLVRSGNVVPADSLFSLALPGSTFNPKKLLRLTCSMMAYFRNTKQLKRSLPSKPKAHYKTKEQADEIKLTGIGGEAAGLSGGYEISLKK